MKNELCISNELLQCIEEYINENEYKIAIYDGANNYLYNIYYSLFFFEKGSSNYFTIWESFMPANPKNILIDENLLTDTNFLYYNILERDVFIINGTNIEDNILFSSCLNNISLGKKKQNIDDVPIYDGSFYPATYQYYNQNGSIIIKKMDIALLHFSSGWAEYEKIQKAKQKRKSPRSSEVVK